MNKIELLKSRLRLPVIVSPMFLVSGVDLVIACCKAGVLGTFPSLNGRTSGDFESMLQQITKELSNWAKENNCEMPPFGVNLIVNTTNPRIQSDLELCIKYKVPLVITSLGASKQVVEAIHSYGGLVFHDIIKKRHAEKAAEVGVDGIIAVAVGAGGHAGTLHPFALMQEVRSVFQGDIILAGSISHGNEILAAEILDATFAYVGTRFMATKESLASDAYRQMIVDCHAEDLIYTDRVSGVHANFLIPSLQQAHWDLSKDVHEDFSKMSGAHAKAWKDVWSAGQGISGIDTIPSVKELVDSMFAEYTKAKEKLKQSIEK